MAKRIELPTTEERVRALRVGDEALVSGPAVVARAAAHARVVRADDPRFRALAEGAFVYHCAPVVARDPATGRWRFAAAGPAPSARQEPWAADLLARYGVRGILGRGGMGPRTLAALAAHGGVYLEVAPALAVTLARCVAEVRGVHLLDELGIGGAVWSVVLRDLPAVVTMDAHGATLHAIARPPAP